MSLKAGVFAVVLMLFALSANAEKLSATNPYGTKVILTQEKCASDPWLQEKWKTATLFFQGKMFAACWRVSLDGAAIEVLDSEGDVGRWPKFAFSKETDV